jgi:hypothetical protein
MSNETSLQKLSTFLLSSLAAVIKPNNLDAWQESGTLILSGEDKGQAGFEVAKWKHSAVITIENFPHRKVNPYNLLAMVAAFLIDNEWPCDQYKLSDPEIDIDVVSKDNATVIIEVELVDDIELIPIENGPVQFNGTSYAVSLLPVLVAEEIDVNVKIEN